MRVLVIGASGQLGMDVAGSLAHHAVSAPPHSELDIGDEERAIRHVTDLSPDVVLNLAAFHDVPSCEKRPQSAFHVNAVAPRILARACSKVKARFVHISTDYVFDGRKGGPYAENDPPGPLMIYGASKLAGEHLAMAECENTFVLRTTGLFGSHACRAKPGGRNFVETMLHLGRTKGEVKVVADQRCCPTYAKDLARQIRVMIDASLEPGIYHAVSPRGCSWFEFARMIFAAAGMPGVEVIPVASDAYPSAFRRPADSRLATEKLEKLGVFVMRPLEEALASYLKEEKAI